MITFLRRCYGAALTVLGAVTGTPTQAKQAAATNLWPADPDSVLHVVLRPNCGSDHERNPDPSRPAEEPATTRRFPGATVSGLVEGPVGGCRLPGGGGATSAPPTGPTGGDAA